MATDSPELDSYPLLASWWRSVSRMYNELKPHTTKHDLLGQIDYQGKLTRQFPPEEERVVYTGRGEQVAAARVSDARTLVDHALYWTRLPSAAEAHYFCAVMNSTTLRDQIGAALSKGLFGGRNIHRAPFRAPWPRFDCTDSLHQALARLGEEAEALAADVDLTGVVSTSRARALIRAQTSTTPLGASIDRLVGELLSR